MKQQLNKDGFVIIENFFDNELLMQIENQIIQIVLNVLKNKNISDSKDLYKNLQLIYEFDKNIYLDTIRTFSRVWGINQGFAVQKVRNLIQSLGVDSPIIPTGPVTHLLSETLKIPNGYFGQGVHQDWTSMQGSLNSLVAWVALTDVTKKNFPVEAIPGSHRNGLLPGEPLQDYFKIDSQYYDDSKFVPIELKKGSAVVFSSFLVHRSGVDQMCGFRIGASCRYEDASEDTYIERNYPTVYRRFVERPLLNEGFPTVDLVLKQYT